MQTIYIVVGILFTIAVSLLILVHAFDKFTEAMKHLDYNARVSQLRGRLYNHIRWSGYEFPIIEYAFEEAAKSLEYQSTDFHDSSAFREELRKRYRHLIRAEELHKNIGSMGGNSKPSTVPPTLPPAPTLSSSEEAKLADMVARAKTEP
jgi:hypothetical protein